MIVCNATILIYLGKLNKLDLLKTFFKKIVIPKAVFEEVVVVGKKGNHIDAFLVEKAVNEEWIIVRETIVLPSLKEFGIDEGEAQAISLAVNLKTTVLLDQTHARIAAKAFGLMSNGTIFVLLKALKKNSITFDEFIDALEQLIDVGFRMSEEVYLEAIKKAKEISNKN